MRTAPVKKTVWRRAVSPRRSPALAVAMGGLARAPLEIPSIEGASTPKEDAAGLLRLAAEVEHALLVQYLYAAASLPIDFDDPDDANRKLTGIAVQEMMHLLSVQNLLIALDGPAAIHLGRDQWRTASELNPMPLTLEPVSRPSLATYIVAEMPGAIADPALRARVASLITLANQHAGVTEHRVGAIYAALAWLFQTGDDPRLPLRLGVDDGYIAGWHVTPQDLQATAVIQLHAADRDEWRATSSGYIMEPVTSIDDAWNLIQRISEQGEGLGDSHDSHFTKFLGLLDRYDGLKVRALPTTPSGRHRPPRDARSVARITNEYTTSWADLFDIRYNMLLLDIGQSLLLPKSDSRRPTLENLAFDTMLMVIGRTADHLSMLPLETAGSAPAGPTFGLIDEEIAPDTGQAGWDRQRRFLDIEEQTLAAIRGHADFGQDVDGQSIVDDLVAPGGLHEARRRFFDTGTPS